MGWLIYVAGVITGLAIAWLIVWDDQRRKGN
jgi:hypothetical protein